MTYTLSFLLTASLCAVRRYITTAGEVDLGKATGPGSRYRMNPKCKEWEELMDADFHGGWTKMDEIHSSDREWNASLCTPMLAPVVAPAAAAAAPASVRSSSATSSPRPQAAPSPLREQPPVSPSGRINVSHTTGGVMRNQLNRSVRAHAAAWHTLISH